MSRVRVPKDHLRAQLVLAANEKMRLARERELVDACTDHWRWDAEFWRREAQMGIGQRLARWLRRWFA